MMKREDEAIIKRIYNDISSLTMSSPPTKKLEDYYLASCSKALQIKTEVSDYVNQEIDDSELLEMKLDTLEKSLEILGKGKKEDEGD